MNKTTQKIDISIGNTGGYYGGSPNIRIRGDKNGKLIYEFSQPGWDFDTESQLEAASLISKSKFKNAREFKEVPFVRPTPKDWEECAYWMTGGNAMWRFGSDEDFVGNWDTDYSKVARFVEKELGREISSCKTMFDVIQKLSKADIIVDFYEEFPELWEDDEEEEYDDFVSESLMNDWKNRYLRTSGLENEEENFLEEDAGETYHLMAHRSDRSRKIASELPEGKLVAVNILDRGHPNGPEAFALLDNGVIQVYNAITKRHITDLIARPHQIISRMGEKFTKLPEETKKKILEIATKNTQLGRNNW